MIHSLSGGVIKDEIYNTFVKVEILEGEFKSKLLWYISDIPFLSVGDIVCVNIGSSKAQIKSKVVQINKNVSQKCSPIPTKQAKHILFKI